MFHLIQFVQMLSIIKPYITCIGQKAAYTEFVVDYSAKPKKIYNADDYSKQK